jgi:hypothetical protein
VDVLEGSTRAHIARFITTPSAQDREEKFVWPEPFRPGSARLNPDALSEMQALRTLLRGYTDVSIHVDIYSSDNASLNAARADVIRSLLTVVPNLRYEMETHAGSPSRMEIVCRKPKLEVMVTGFRPIRIHCGSVQPITDSRGNIWLPDSPPEGSRVYAVHVPITGSADQALFRTHRFTTTGVLRYDFVVPPGRYLVRLLFAELFHGAGGKRQFRVEINDETVESELDVFTAAGGMHRALDRSYRISAKDGRLAIKLTSVIDSPILNGIEILAAN